MWCSHVTSIGSSSEASPCKHQEVCVAHRGVLSSIGGSDLQQGTHASSFVGNAIAESMSSFSNLLRPARCWRLQVCSAVVSQNANEEQVMWFLRESMRPFGRLDRSAEDWRSVVEMFSNCRCRQLAALDKASTQPFCLIWRWGLTSQKHPPYKKGVAHRRSCQRHYGPPSRLCSRLSLATNSS